MPEYTVDDLVTVLQECAGELDGAELSAETLDMPFSDLGYDSLALLNTVGRLQRDLGIRLPDDAATAEDTPRDLLDQVNALLSFRV
jgi:act minimal PKS acyl carrier protein